MTFVLPPGLILERKPEGFVVYVAGIPQPLSPPIASQENALFFASCFRSFDLSQGAATPTDKKTGERLIATRQRALELIEEAERRGMPIMDLLVEKQTPAGAVLKSGPRGWSAHHAASGMRLHPPDTYLPDAPTAIRYTKQVADRVDLTKTEQELRSMPEQVLTAWKTHLMRCWNALQRELHPEAARSVSEPQQSAPRQEQPAPSL